MANCLMRVSCRGMIRRKGYAESTNVSLSRLSLPARPFSSSIHDGIRPLRPNIALCPICVQAGRRIAVSDGVITTCCCSLDGFERSSGIAGTGRGHRLCQSEAVVKIRGARSYRPLPPWQAIGARTYLWRAFRHHRCPVPGSRRFYPTAAPNVTSAVRSSGRPTTSEPTSPGTGCSGR